MGTIQKSFEETLAWGQEGEHVVAKHLLDSGICVSPLYQFKGHDKAPVIINAKGETLIMPDLTCFGKNGAFFVEVKRKNQWWHGECLETGMDLRHWQHYIDVALNTKLKVYVFFLHEDSGKPTCKPTGLFYGEVSRLLDHGPRVWKGRKINGSDLVFFRREWLSGVDINGNP